MDTGAVHTSLTTSQSTFYGNGLLQTVDAVHTMDSKKIYGPH